MINVSRRPPFVAAGLLLALALSQVVGDGGPRNLLDVRVTDAVPERTDVILAVDGQVSYESQVLEGPDRLVLDLQGVVIRL